MSRGAVHDEGTHMLAGQSGGRQVNRVESVPNVGHRGRRIIEHDPATPRDARFPRLK